MPGRGEQLIVDAIHECFGKDCDCTDHNKAFGELGLDSMALLTLHRKIEDKSKLKIHITDVYEHPTIAKLGSYIDNHMK